MAFGASTITSASGAVSDLFASQGHKYKAKGDLFEAENYDRASALAKQNVAFTEQSTAIKQSQLDRENYKMLGGQAADVGGAGLASSGSALALMHDSASQGALTKAVGSQQGLITEAGYQEQADSYTTMAKAARMAAEAEENASTGSTITGLLKGAAGVASLFTGGFDISKIGNLFMGGGSPSGYGSG